MSLPVRKLCTFLGSIVLFVPTVAYLWSHPVFGPDSIAYIACAEHLHTSNFTLVRDITYSVADSEIPADQMQTLNQDPWIQDMRKNPAVIQEYLPLFAIKPLFIWSIAALHSFGIPYVKAERLINWLSSLLILSIAFLWIRRYAGAIQAVLSTFLIAWSPFVLLSLKQVMPDALASCFAITGLYFVFELDLLLYGSVFLAIAELARPDYCILLFLTLVGYLLASGKKMPELKHWLSLLIGIVGYEVAHLQASTYTWSRGIEVFVMKNQPFSLKLYLDAIVIQGFLAFVEGLSALLLICAWLFFSRSLTRMQLACVCVQLACISRIMIYPLAPPRFFLTQYVTILVIAAIVLGCNKQRIEPRIPLVTS
jgi:hypothetical protein